MPNPPAERQVIFNADDFGASTSVNAAVIDAHERGVLTSASLMVNGDAAGEAVELARRHPALGVGLHLTFVQGMAATSAASAPGVVDDLGRLPDNPVRFGAACYFNRDLRASLRREMAAQFERFQQTGLTLDHVNGHLNFHLHPVVFEELLENAATKRVRHVRLTRDPFWLNARIAGGEWGCRISHALIFQLLCARSRRRVSGKGIGHVAHVFGLLQNGRVDEDYLLRLLPRLPAGTSEIYSHPCQERFPHEHAALVSGKVVALLKKLGIRAVRHQDL